MSDRMFRKRSRLTRLLLFTGLTLLIGRLAFIQVAQAQRLTTQADKVIMTDKDVVGTRGTIMDRNGEKLAFTGVAYDINIDVDKFRADDAVKNGDTPEEYAHFLAPLLGMSEDEILKYMNVYKTNDKVKGIGLGPKSKRVDASVNDKINAMHDQKKFLGITTSRVDIREYPNGNFASHVLGYYGLDPKDNKEKGMAGIEAEYDDVLTGTPGRVSYYTDREGNPLPTYKPEVQVPAVNGEDVVLTIDKVIQHDVDDELNKIVDKYAPKHAAIIVADPNNGEILAMGSRPSYDPNNYAKADGEALWNNWALQAFEPGSTFKVFVLTGALQQHKLNLDETFPSGQITVDGRTISDWNYTGWGTITYRQAVYNSSNTGFVRIGQKLGKTDMYDTINAFGFDKPTGIDLPNEGTSFLFDPKKMRDVDLASMSFGQGVSVTPIQQVAAAMAVANGGKVYQPHLLKELRDPKTGKTVKEVEPKVTHTVANEETMSTVRQVLEETINYESNKTGYIKGYHVAGKTGTAQVPRTDGGAGYSDTAYRLSYLTFAPAKAPRVLVYVTVDQPSQNAPSLFGSTIAEPSGHAVLEETLRYLQVPIDPNDGKKDSKDGQQDQSPQNTQPQEPQTFVSVPDFIGATPDLAKQMAQQGSLKLQTVGDGPKVTGQWPDASYGQVPEGTEIKLYFGPEGQSNGQVKMPDLRGMSMREALETLSLLRLSMDPTGDGYVVKQAVPAGTLVPYGSSVKLDFAPQS